MSRWLISSLRPSEVGLIGSAQVKAGNESANREKVEEDVKIGEGGGGGGEYREDGFESEDEEIEDQFGTSSSLDNRHRFCHYRL